MEEKDNPAGKDRRMPRGQGGRWAAERMRTLVRECRTKAGDKLERSTVKRLNDFPMSWRVTSNNFDSNMQL